MLRRILRGSIKTTTYGCTTLQIATLADKTGNIKLPLWGNALSVTKGRSYKFFNKILQVNTTRDTKFVETDALEDVDDEIPEIKLTNITGKVCQIQIQSTTKCIKCAKPLDDIATTTTTTIRCLNCKSKQHIADVKKFRKALMGIEDATKCTPMLSPSQKYWKHIATLDLIYPLKCPSWAPGGRISYLNTFPKRIGPMMIHTKFD